MIKETLSNDLFALTGRRMDWTQDETGNVFGWLRLKHPGLIGSLAEYLAGKKARLCTMTTYAGKRSDPHKRRSLAYHFSLSSLVLTITTPLYDVTTYEPLPVASVTPWFRNADWNERECMEMFNIEVSGHPNPKRLFLDESMDKGVMEQLLPFSAMVHGIASSTLWERVMATKSATNVQAEREKSLLAHPKPVKEEPAPEAEPKAEPKPAEAPKKATVAKETPAEETNPPQAASAPEAKVAGTETVLDEQQAAPQADGEKETKVTS